MFNSTPGLNGQPPRRQQGVILLLIVLSLMAVAGAVFLAAVASKSSTRAVGAVELGGPDDSLSRAKEILIGFMISPPSSIGDIRPGMLPIPDARTPASYTGNQGTQCLSDSITGQPTVGANATNKRCLGKFPWKELGLDLNSTDAADSVGVVPWLAVSANLVWYDNCLKVLNSDVSALASPGTATCPSLSAPFAQPTALPHAWLTVRDSAGNVISNKVAAVLLLPGAPISTETRLQLRSAAAPGNPTDYLDSVRLPLGCTSGCVTYDNAGMNNEFITIPAGTKYPNDAQDTTKRGQTVPFNDALLYITVDEYMYYVQKRVLSEMAAAVRDSRTKTTSWPWAAAFTSPVSFDAFMSNINSGTSIGSLTGLMPFFPSPPLANVPFSNPTKIPNYPTSVSWSIASFNSIAKNCVQVRTGPNRWADLNQNVRTEASSLTGTATATGRWRGTGSVEFWNSATPTSLAPFNKTFALFGGGNATNCNAGGPLPGGTNSSAYSVTRTVTFDVDATCNSTPTVSYGLANATQTQRWNWSCPTLATGSGFGMTFVDAIASPIVRTTTNLMVTTATINLSNMRYQPVMPSWFYDQLWYQTAFYALARASIPGGNAVECAGVPNISLGTASTTNPIVGLSGKNLTANTRPTASLSDYFEGTNVSAFTNCSFVTSATSTGAAQNDAFLIVTPP